VLKTESRRGYRLVGNWTMQSRDAGNPPIGPTQIRVTDELARTNFPIATVPLIGRSADAQRLGDFLSAYRVVTLTGPGGIGKTTLALQLGRNLLPEFADGCWFVELASLSDPALVPSAVASVLGLRLVGDVISSAAVAGAIGRQHLLLILDNCEHVISVAAELVEAIVSQCPNTTLLTTSREILRADGEHVYRVPPLDVPAQETSREILDHSAVELFVARSKAFNVNHTPAPDELPLIADICRRLDGIPLAIEFAAARTASLGLENLATGLDDRFALLISGRRTALPRHRTLRATLDWSYDLLTEEERALLCRLAVFRGGFTLDGAVAVSGGDFGRPAVMNGIASLIDKSLVAIDAVEAISRWHLLETIRSYALEKLSERGDADEAVRRHAAYFRDLMVSGLPDFRSRLPAEELVRYGREVDNVRAALDWSFSPSGDAITGIDLTAAYAPMWMNFSLVGECRERCEQALHRLDANAHLDARLQMLLQLNLGEALVHTSGPSAQAQAFQIQALETAEILGDLGAQALALFFLHGVYWWRGDYGEMAKVTERMGQIAQRIEDTSVVTVANLHLGDTLITAGRLSEAQQCFERVIQLVHVEDQRAPIWRRRFSDLAKARAMLARVLWLQGFVERAREVAQASLEDAPATDQRTMCQVVYFGISKIAPMTGDFAAAERAISRLKGTAISLNSRFWMTIAQFIEGKLLVERGAFSEGAVALRTAFATCSETGWRPSYPEFRGSLALALRGLGRLDEAANVVSEAMAAAGRREDGQHWYAPELLRIKADILLRQSADQSGLAEDCFAQAAEMARGQGARTWELRIALSLAHLRAAQGRRDEAKQILAPVYDSFTEGFDTTDLKEAKRFLDAL
jgi:predicted ATPase